jgi:hypothetical protein
MITDIEIVNLADLPQQTGTDFEMVGRNSNTGEAVRISLSRIADYLLENSYIPYNKTTTISASGGSVSLNSLVNGSFFSVSGLVSKIIVPDMADHTCFRILFSAAADSVLVVSEKQLAVCNLLPIGQTKFTYIPRAQYMMEIHRRGDILYVSAQNVGIQS